MNAVVKQKVAKFNSQLLAMPLRSRLLLLLACLSVVYGAVSLGLAPQVKANVDKIGVDIAAAEKKLTDMREVLIKLEAAKERESDAAYLVRIRELKVKAEQAEKRRADIRAQLVNPNDMALLVEKILAGNARVELLELKNQEPERIDGTKSVAATVATATAPAPAAVPGALKIIEAVLKGEPVASGEGIYKHPMTIQVKGRYWDVVRFIKAIEDQPHKVLWGDLKLATDAYPFSIAEITLYTLNLDTAWIRL